MELKKPFEGDTQLAGLMAEIILNHDITAVVETGTETGASANEFAEYVPKVYTCDVEHKLDRPLLDNVIYHLMPSYKMVDQILPHFTPDDRILFFLDAHVAPEFCAVRQELEVIARRPPAYLIIAVHDFKVPGHPELGFDTYDAFGELELEIIEPFLPRIYGDGAYRVSYNTEATGAKRGACIVEPYCRE